MTPEMREKAKAEDWDYPSQPVEYLRAALTALGRAEEHDGKCIAALARQGSEIVKLRHELAAEHAIADRLVAAIRRYFANTDISFDPIEDSLAAYDAARKG